MHYKFMNKYIITGLAAILCGCTTYKNPDYSSYGTRVYSDDYDSGYYYTGEPIPMAAITTVAIMNVSTAMATLTGSTKSIPM